MEDTLKLIKIWADNSCAFLSESTPYAQGYKDGILMAKRIIIDMINQYENEEKDKRKTP